MGLKKAFYKGLRAEALSFKARARLIAIELIKTFSFLFLKLFNIIKVL
jgi:hypothetical protein